MLQHTVFSGDPVKKKEHPKYTNKKTARGRVGPLGQSHNTSQAMSGVLGALGVAMGAFGAHGLKNYTSDPQLLESWKTAANYQMRHDGLGRWVAKTSVWSGTVLVEIKG